MRRILLLLLVFAAYLILHANSAHAQAPDPAIRVFNDLVGSGYDVIEVGNYPDAQGNPDPKTVFAHLETVTTDLNDRYVMNQTLRSFRTLHKYYSSVDNFVAVLRFDRWLFIFVTNVPDWDDVVAERISIPDFWNKVRGQVRIYDSIERKYIQAKDFGNILQTNKDQTSKDFSGQSDSPLPPVNQTPGAEAENILFELSTTYLPADGTAQAYLLATLTDREFAGLPGRGMSFSFEVRGQDERPLPASQTDQFGTARSRIASSRALDLVLLRAATSTLNASAQMLVGAPPGTDTSARVKAVIDGLTSQGYADADADYFVVASPAGDNIRLGIAAVRVTSKTFDRNVYSQLSRMLGTMRTVMPEAAFLRPILLYAAADGHDYSMLFTLRSDIWDAYVRGEIGENQLWASVDYDGAVNENGVRTNEKDFLSKNFSGTDPVRYSSVARHVSSALTPETWGEQLTVGSFLVPVGGYADTLSISELSGSANGLKIFATPEYNTPLFTYNKGDDASLAALRLEAGQYILAVNGAGAPAKAILQFTEHLPR